MVQQALDLLAAANAEAGVHIKAQIYPRPIGLLFGLDLSLNPFSLHPSYKAIAHLPLQERVKRMRDPVLRAQILSEQSDATHPNPMQKFLVARSLDAYPFTQNVDYEPDPATSLRSIAARDGKDVCAVAYDTLLEQNGGAILFLPINNFAAGTLDSTYDMLVNDHTLIGLGDGGAHYGFICDASFPTFVLRHWTRERTRGDGRHLSIAEAVHRLSMRNAMAVGLKDRGVIATGMKADLNVIDYDRLQLASPQAAFDLPAGGRRLTQKAQGIDATIVNGVVTYRKGVPTGELPGRLVRGRGV
jgi:N-acyl-D-amino-acid deacylase